MEIAAALDFVRPRRNGVLATLKRDGRPQLSNITYYVDGDRIKMSVTATRAKTANARRDPRVSLHVSAEDFWSYVVIDGHAELSDVATEPDDPTADALVAYYRAIRSEDHPDWAEYRAAMVADQRVILSIVPTGAYGIIAR